MFIGNGHYLVIATVCKAWCAAYHHVHVDVDSTSTENRSQVETVELKKPSCYTYYQLLLHSNKFLKALWHSGLASSNWTESHDGR
jgi:hypothetical protein